MEEEVDTKREWAIKDFKSFKDMEDIKIAFAWEAFLEGFEICMRVAKNLSEINLDLLPNKPDDEASPSNVDAEVGAASPITELTLEISEPTATAPEFPRELEVAKSAATSFVAMLPKVKNFL